MLPGILKKFCDRKGRINVWEIVDEVRRLTGIDQINFYPSAEIDANIVRGFVDRYTAYPDTPEAMEVADIYFPIGMDDDWKRLVQTKELVQLFDSDDGIASDHERISKLVTEIVTPREVALLSNPTKEDHYALSWALALLLPRDCRKLLLKPYEEGKIAEPEIANIIKIPVRFVPFIFSSRFGKWIDELLTEDGN